MGALLLCLVVCVVLWLVGTVSTASGANIRPPAMYVFGSSILDVGNNNYLPGAAVGRANRRYNGIDFPGSIPTGRFSNGYNIADYIAKNMGFACSPPAYLSLAPNSSGPLVQIALSSGINYASGGAGILDSTNAGITIPLSKQVQYFNATRAKMAAAVGPHAATTLLSKSIFLLGIGNNDMVVFAFAERARNKSAADTTRDAAALYADLISNYTATITELYAMGARRFAIVGVGLQGCLPGARVLNPSSACWAGLNELAGGFNAALRPELAGLAAGRLPGIAYSIGDCFGFTRDAVDDPRAAGFASDVAAACCGGGRLRAEVECGAPNSTVCADRDRRVFWDRAHFTQRMAFLVARAFWDGPAKYTTPINFMQLAQSS